MVGLQNHGTCVSFGIKCIIYNGLFCYDVNKDLPVYSEEELKIP